MNDGGKYDIPDKYINNFCELVIGSMWRCLSNAIASFELYGDAWGFKFNLGGYIDSYYKNDNIRWQGFNDKQVDRLKESYSNIVRSLKDVGLDIIEHNLRALSDYDIEQIVENIRRSPRRTFRNIEYIAYERKNGRRSAEDIYTRFLERTKELMHYNDNEE